MATPIEPTKVQQVWALLIRHEEMSREMRELRKRVDSLTEQFTDEDKAEYHQLLTARYNGN